MRSYGEQGQHEALDTELSGMSDAEKARWFRDQGERFEGIFQSRFRRLLSDVTKGDPRQLLSRLSLACTNLDTQLVPLWAKGTSNYHVELAQGFALQHQRGEFADTSLNTGDIATLIYEAADAFNARHFVRLDPSAPLHDHLRIVALEHVRQHTMKNRNVGYPQHVIPIVESLFVPMEHHVRPVAGMHVRDVMAMFSTVVASLDRRASAFSQLLTAIRGPGAVATALEQQRASAPGSWAELDLDSVAAAVQHSSPAGGREVAEAYLSARLPTIHTVTVADFARACPVGVDPAKLVGLLEYWSLSFGQLSDRDAEHFFLDNPVWRKPLIRLDDDTFFWPTYRSFFCFCLDMLQDYVIETGIRKAKQLEKRRGAFLEEAVDDAFTAAFPMGKSYGGSVWKDPVTNAQYENDLLIVVDKCVFIVECKSGKADPGARRGAENSLRRAINDLLVAPSKQAQRFYDFLRENRTAHTFRTFAGEKNEVDLTGTTNFLLLGVTLEHLGAVAPHWSVFRRGGLVRPDFRSAPVVSLAELYAVFELLDGASEKMHYLTRRARFEGQFNHTGNEYDVLALYLETALNVDRAQYARKNVIDIRGKADVLDSYFWSTWLGGHAGKPVRHLTPWWRNMINDLDQSGFEQWAISSYILLNTSFDDQLLFQREFESLQTQVMRSGEAQPSEVYPLLTGPWDERCGIVGLAYRHATTPELEALLKRAAIAGHETLGTKLVVVLAVDVDRRRTPYDALFFSIGFGDHLKLRGI